MERKQQLMEKLERIVSNHFDGIDLRRRSRKRKYVNARAAFFFNARKYFGVTLADVGSFMNMDHASVLYCVRKYDVFVKYDGFKMEHESIEIECAGIPVHKKMSAVELQKRHIIRLTNLCRKLIDEKKNN